MKTLIAAMVALLPTTSYAADLIYVHDNQGVGAEGFDISNLFERVSKGAEIRVGYESTGNVLVEWVRDCDAVAMVNGVVNCFVFMVSDTTLEEGVLNLSSPYAFEQHVFRTDGTRSFIKFDLATNEVLDRVDLQPIGIEWFAGH